MVMRQKLNLPDMQPVLRSGPRGKEEIFDICRKRYVTLTPEEWVRQHFLHYMVLQLGYPASLIIVEAALRVNGMPRRFDILACLPGGRPGLVVECKAPNLVVTQAAFDQVARYNLELGVDYLAVTNGMTHYACRLNHELKDYQFLPMMPDYRTIGGTTG